MRIVDLFSGAGGLTFGFYYQLVNDEFVRTANEIVFANEFDEHAAEAYSANYPQIHMENCDIKQLTDDYVRGLIGDEEVDLIIGGPPCQSFSTVGKRQFDEKAKLYKEYLRMLKIIQPKMFLFENVKGMLSMREQISILDRNQQQVVDDNGDPIFENGEFIIDIISEQLSNIEDVVGYKIVGSEVLNAKDFGVPQSRERVFLIGVRNDLVGGIEWHYPNATYGENLLPYLTIRDAISDLPELVAGGHCNHYTKRPRNLYQQLMRGNNRELTQHYCGSHNEKLTRIIAAVPQGEGRPYINHMVDNGELPESCRLTSGYNNTYGRLVENQPSTTITNNMCTPSALRCIHYGQNRTLSPREGARIQSFPDWFVFRGVRANVTKQIGNAVPPLIAIAIARQIEEVLGGNNG